MVTSAMGGMILKKMYGTLISMIISFVPVLFCQVLYLLYNVNVCEINSI